MVAGREVGQSIVTGTLRAHARRGRRLRVGMHRSGTSAATRVLNLMGLATCMPSDLIKSRGGNERGYWEERIPRTLQRRAAKQGWLRLVVPARAGGATPRPWSSSWRREPAGAEIFRTVHPSRPWVWKDPRLCLLSVGGVTLSRRTRSLSSPFATRWSRPARF